MKSFLVTIISLLFVGALFAQSQGNITADSRPTFDSNKPSVMVAKKSTDVERSKFTSVDVQTIRIKDGKNKERPVKFTSPKPIVIIHNKEKGEKKD